MDKYFFYIYIYINILHGHMDQQKSVLVQQVSADPDLISNNQHYLYSYNLAQKMAQHQI